jgi:O-methyltransferase involved in polyketide biosynthesis
MEKLDNKTDISLGNVQKTLFLPLWGRAVESKKEKPQLVDETAVRVIELVNYDFANMAEKFDDLTQIAWVKRALICDRVIKKFIVDYPNGTIVNIGCGLDTTYERNDNGTLKWYDLDLPDVIELRKKFIKENDRRKFISMSFLEEEWLDQISVDGNVLFIAAGVFYYFEEKQIKEFVIRLMNRFPNSQLLFDVCSPIGLHISNKKVIESSGLDEKSYLIWGVKNKKDILAWDPRNRILGTYYYYRPLKNSIRNILMGLLSDLLGIQYMIHLVLGGKERLG